jgi:hypothetical protein
VERIHVLELRLQEPPALGERSRNFGGSMQRFGAYISRGCVAIAGVWFLAISIIEQRALKLFTIEHSPARRLTGTSLVLRLVMPYFKPHFDVRLPG